MTRSSRLVVHLSTIVGAGVLCADCVWRAAAAGAHQPGGDPVGWRHKRGGLDSYQPAKAEMHAQQAETLALAPSGSRSKTHGQAMYAHQISFINLVMVILASVILNFVEC